MKNQNWLAKLSGVAVTCALGGAVALAASGPAPQHWDNGHNHDHDGQQYRDHGDHGSPAEQQGWAAGEAQGRSDREHNHSFRPTKVDTYKHVPRSPHGYSRDRFKDEYREAFVKGYSRGYGRR